MMNIYEHPWPGLIVSGLVLLVVIWYRRLWPQRRKWWQWALVLIIALSAVALDYFVQTDNEKVKGVIARLVRAAQNEDVNAISRLISDDYHDSLSESRQDFLDRCRARLSGPIIEKNVLTIISRNVNPPSAEVVFTVRVVFDPQGPVYDFQKQMIFKLEARLVKQGDDWLISRLEVLEVDMHPVNWEHIMSSFGEIFD